MLLFRIIVFVTIQIAWKADGQRPSSEGYEFWTAFIPNKGGSLSTNASLTIFNTNNLPSTVNITYNDVTNFFFKTSTVLVVDTGKMATFALPSTAIDDSPTEMGFNPIAPATVYISATQPVSIIASSIAADGSTGDRYLVLPTTLLQKNYVVAGRSLINGQQSSSVHMVYIIVTQDGTEISTSILGLNGVSTRPMNAGEMLKYTADDHYTIAINSSKPVALVAGTTCFAYADGRCDHQAYMPLPVPDTCSNPGDQLYLLADINGNNNNYFVGSTYDCNIQYDYDSMSPSGGGSGRLNPIEPVQLFNSSISPEQNPQSTHTITTSTNPLQITRLGQNPTPQGVYLVTVPSVTQYVTGTVFFTAFGRTNSIQVIGDTAAQQSALLNGQAAALGFWQPYSNVDGYSITHVPVDPGQLHNFTASGKFVITVYGQGGGMSYAYLPAVNAPSYVSSSSTSSTTSTTTTTSVPSSTPTVTTTFSSSSTSAPSPPTATEGVEFWTMFIPNKGGYCNTNASMTFFNKNQQGVTVNITYNNNTMTSPVIMTTVQIFVQAASMYTFPFPTTSLEPTDNVPLFNEAPGATVYITSTLPISIVASSYSLDGSSGDRFLVLPTTLLQNNYVVAGKNQANLGIPGSTQVAYIIVTQNDTNVTATLLGKDASANQARSDFGLSSGTIIKFVSINQYTVVVSSSKPVAMVVGSNCFMFTNGICDHQAHMPLPVPSSCTFPGNDRHLLNNFNSSTNNYFIASTFNCDIPFDYDTNLESGGGTGRLTPNQPVMMTDFTLPGQNNADTHIVNSDTNPLLITQMGNSKTGTYLVYVPAIEQFVSGTVLFAAFDSTVQMQVIADKTTENGGALLDGKGFPGSWIQFPGADGYFITNVPLTQGLHSFSSNGKFLITIYGSTQTSEYAYLPAMSAPVYAQTQTTTVSSTSSSSSSTSTTTSTSVSSSTSTTTSTTTTTTTTSPSTPTSTPTSTSTSTSTFTSTSIPMSSSTSTSTSISTSTSSPASASPSTLSTTLSYSSTSSSPSVTPSSPFDSEGTDFWTAFIINKKPGRTNTNASLTFINRNVFSVNVNVTYNNLTFQSKLTDFVTVPGMSTVTRYFPQDSLDTTVYSEPADDGFNFVPESSFRIQSNAPISVFATSTSLDGSSGDTYLVLPTTMLQTTYVVAGADQVNLSNYGSRHVVYFIATQDSTEFHVTMMRNGAVSQGFEEFDAGGMCSFITAGAYTVIVTTTKPIAVVVGTDCFSYAEGACDHQAYMPQPLPVDCYTTDGSFFDSHPVPNQLPRTNKYFVASIYGCNTTYDYTTGTCPINCGSGLLTSGQPVGFTDFSLPSNQSFYVTSASNPLLVTRQGKNALHGAYLLDVPSMSQFVTGSVQFFAFGSNCSLQVVAFLSNGQALLDGQPFGANWTLFSDSMNVQIGIATFPITPGQHTFSMDGGSFFIEVYGSFSGISSYAYLPAINAPNYVSFTSTTSVTTAVTAATTSATQQTIATATTASSPSTAISSAPSATASSITITNTSPLTTASTTSPTTSTITTSSAVSTPTSGTKITVASSSTASVSTAESSTTTAIPTSQPDGLNSTITTAINLTMNQVISYPIAVNISKGVTLGMAESSGRLLVYASLNCPTTQGTPILDTSGTAANSVFLNETSINNLYACQATDAEADQSASKYLFSDRSLFGDVSFDQSSLITIYASIQGANNESNSGTFTIGPGDIYYKPPKSEEVANAGLSTAEIVLIVLGSVIILVIILSASVCVYKSRKLKQKRTYNLQKGKRKEYEFVIE